MNIYRQVTSNSVNDFSISQFLIQIIKRFTCQRYGATVLLQIVKQTISGFDERFFQREIRFTSLHCIGPKFQTYWGT